MAIESAAEFDARLRREAMAWLTVRTNDGLDPISTNDLLDFQIDGRPFRLMDAQRGIRKPAELDAALSIRTVFRPEGAARPYEDSTGPEGLIRYKWRGTEADHPENRALRVAMVSELPLIWFFGVGPGIYHPVFPVFLLGEELESQQFVVDPDVGHGLVRPDSPVEEAVRRYILRETRYRVHQPVFRATIMRAYGTRCAVCALAHTELLDAAHIIPDSQERGLASIRNGLALCKIHHAAYDSNILGIRPDLVVQIKSDLLDEVDGPMLQHGLKERHNQRLMVLPKVRGERPGGEFLEWRYDAFQSA
jgi:putative restriction endonuclease